MIGKITFAGILVTGLVTIFLGPAAALTCEEEITRLTGICVQEKGLNNAKSCRAESTQRLRNCRNFQGEMADFTGQAQKGRNDPEGNVYKSCDDKRREGYVLDKYEIDYCGGLPRRNN